MTKGQCNITILGIAMLAILSLSTYGVVNVQAEVPPVLKQLDEAFVQVAEKVTPAVVNIS